MTCEHEQLLLDCNDCRKKIRFFDTEIEFQLYKIKVSCEKLINLAEKSETPDRIYDTIVNVIDGVEEACEVIKGELKYEDVYSGDLWLVDNSRHVGFNK